MKNKLFSLTATAALMLGLFASSIGSHKVKAEEPNIAGGVQGIVQIEQKFGDDDNPETYATATFTYKVEPNYGSQGQLVTSADPQTGQVIPGAGYAVVYPGTFSSLVQSSVCTVTNTDNTKVGQLNFSKVPFYQSGIHRYFVSQTAQPADSSITTCTTKYCVDLFVKQGNDGNRYINQIVAYPVTDEFDGTDVVMYGNDKVALLQFANQYGNPPAKLRIYKKIEGTTASAADDFSFKLTVDKLDTMPDGVKYTVTTDTQTYNCTVGTACEFTLKANQTATTMSLPVGATYKIEEVFTSDDFDGYSTQFYKNGNEDEKSGGRVTTGTIEKETDVFNNSVTFINKRDMSTPTGLRTNAIPFACALVGLAGCTVMMKKRRNGNED